MSISQIMIDCVYINLPDSKSLHKDLHSRCHKARSIIKDIKRKTKSVRQHLTIPIPSTKKNAKTVFFVALFCKYWVNQKWRPKSPEARDMCFSVIFFYHAQECMYAPVVAPKTSFTISNLLPGLANYFVGSLVKFQTALHNTRQKDV